MLRRRHLLCLAVAFECMAGAFGAVEPRAITLPPFLVEEKAQPLPWQHAETADWEILSSCSEHFTRTLIANHHRLHVLLGELVPPALQFKTTEKSTMLFVDSTQQPPTSQEVVAQMALTAAEQDRLEDVAAPIDDGRLRRRPPPPRYSFLPNLRLWDRDSGVLFAVLRESEFNAHRVALTPDYVAYLLRNRLPSLPPWYISGVVTLFARAHFTEDALTLDRLDWLSATGSAALKAGPEANRPLMPLADFFAGDLSSNDPAQGEGLSLWQAQAALFVRWGVAGRGSPRREALSKFVTRAATELVTEAMFRECFGVDYAEAHKQLTTYLPEAIRERLALRPVQRPQLPDYPIRPATDAEVARIRGDWERLEIGYVKTQFPIFTQKYLEQARRTFMRAHEGGTRDPRLLAVMGLCEVDAGNDAGARELLESADAAGKSMRPRACFELARLRFAALRASASAAGLTAEQTSQVFAPLMLARELQPPLPEVYLLMAEVWAASASAPSKAQWAVLEEGVRLFPRRTELVHRTAELSLRHGFSDTARWVIQLGLTLAPDAAARTRFEALQAKSGGRE